jgi:hypothetical protein
MVIAASAKVELAKREWIPDPSVSLGAQHYNAGSQAVSELNAGVSIDLPWFNPKKYRAGEQEISCRKSTPCSITSNSTGIDYYRVRGKPYLPTKPTMKRIKRL